MDELPGASPWSNRPLLDQYGEILSDEDQQSKTSRYDDMRNTDEKSFLIAFSVPRLKFYER